jgi:hypothetical protein
MTSRAPPSTQAQEQRECELTANTEDHRLRVSLIPVTTSSNYGAAEPLLSHKVDNMPTASATSAASLPNKASARLLAVSLFFGLASLAWGLVRPYFALLILTSF